MPRVVPLYRSRPRAPVEQVHPLAPDPGCQRCGLAGTGRSTCIPPEWTGDTGGVLVVSDYPGVTEDTVGRPLVGKTGHYLRPLLRKMWGEPLVLTNAICCAKGKRLLDQRARAGCLPYLANTIRAAKPVKILAMGEEAIIALTGRDLPVLSVRKGYGWVRVDGRDVPVYLLPNPVNALRNRHLRTWFEEDLRWALGSVPPFGPCFGGEARIVEGEADALVAEDDLTRAGRIAFDIETAGRFGSALQVLTLAAGPVGVDYAWVWGEVGLRDVAARRALCRILRNPEIAKVGSHVQFDQLGCLADLGARVVGIVNDVRLARKLAEGDASGELEVMAELVGMGGHKGEAQAALVQACAAVRKIVQLNSSPQVDLFSKSRMWSGGFLRDDVVASITPDDEPEAFAYGFLPYDVRERYCALDAIATGRLDVVLRDWLSRDAPSIGRVHREIVMPAARAMARVEEWGVHVDRGNIRRFCDYLAMKRAEVADAIRQHAPVGFNPGSTYEVADLLYKRLGLPSSKTTDTGRDSVDEGALKDIRHLHPIVSLILDHRGLAKLDGTYATGMLRHVRADGRVHPSILLDGARSGRASVKDPPLQTIPRDSDSVEGKLARDCFAVPPGHVMIQLDYSQLELRIAAVLSGDPEMRRLYECGADLHQDTAEFIAPAVWRIKPAQVEKKHRTKAKIVNFSLVFGKGDRGLAEDLGVSLEEARAIRASVLGRFGVLAGWIERQVKETRETGYCWTWWDGGPARRRAMWRILSDDGEQRGTAERGSFNTPIQGTASEFLLRSLTKTVEWIEAEGVPAKAVLPVHDAMLIEAREDVVDEVVSVVKGIMEGWNSLGVPLIADVETGLAWGSLKKQKAAPVATLRAAAQ